MRILIAPDSFKGTMTAREAAEAMARGARDAIPSAECDVLPIADGGEGLIDVLERPCRGQRREIEVRGPRGESISAAYLLIDDGRTAVVEAAQAIGLTLLPACDRNPLSTTSFGVGELIAAAIDAGADTVVVGLGGSGTNDGGIGMAQALGIEFHGVPMPAAGGDLLRVQSIDLRQRRQALDRVEIVGACDVTNPLLGPMGATYTYGEQKGATIEAQASLEAGLQRVAMLCPWIKSDEQYMGAAGGLGFGLAAFCRAKLISGADFVLDRLGLDERLTRADLVLTGEGRLDGQSINRKACIALALRAKQAGVDVLAVVGSTAGDVDRVRDHGVTSWYRLADLPFVESQLEADRLACATRIALEKRSSTTNK